MPERREGSLGVHPMFAHADSWELNKIVQSSECGVRSQKEKASMTRMAENLGGSYG